MEVEAAVTVVVGGVFRRADGSLVGKWRRSDEPRAATKQRRLHASDEVAARAELEAYAAKRIGVLVRPAAGNGPPRTLGEVAERHFAALRAARSRSVSHHESRWNAWCADLGPIPLAAVTHGVLLDWVLRLRAARAKRAPTRALAPRTIRSSFATVSMLLSTAVAHGWLAANPSRGVRRWLPIDVGVERPDRVRALSLEQVRALLSDTSIPLHWWIVYLVAIFVGARQGEIRGLRWTDVSLPDDDGPITSDDVPTITVRASFASTTKTGRVRVVPVHPELVGALRWWRKHGWLAFVGRPPLPTDFVFPSRSSRMHSAGAHPKALRAHLEALGLPVCSFHGLRHTAASLYRAAGVTPDDIAQILGHRFPGMVHHYARPTLHYMASQLGRLSVCAGCATKRLDTGSADAASCTRSDDVSRHNLHGGTVTMPTKSRRKKVIDLEGLRPAPLNTPKTRTRNKGADQAPAPAAPASTPTETTDPAPVPFDPPTELGGIAFASFSPAFRDGFLAGSDRAPYRARNPHDVSTDAAREWGDGWMAATARERSYRVAEDAIEIPRDYDAEHADGDLEARWRVRCEMLPRELRALLVFIPADDAPVVVPMHHKEASLLFAFMRSTSSVRVTLVAPGGVGTRVAPEAVL